MSFTYLVNEHSDRPRKYVLSYSELREQYHRFVDMTDEEFLKNLPQAAHLACVISWLKESGQGAVADTGIVHELIHLIESGPEYGNGGVLHEIRDTFKNALKLD